MNNEPRDAGKGKEKPRKRQPKVNHLGDLAKGTMILGFGIIGFVVPGWIAFVPLHGGLLLTMAASFTGLILGLLAGFILAIAIEASGRK